MFRQEELVDCCDIISNLEQINPLKYQRRGVYEHKFKEFLCAKALGLDPSRPWNGTDDANGGYIVAKSNGEVLAFHIYNRDKFKEYLLDNTQFERGSTTRHHYASIYEENGHMFINLNLQIRFKQITHSTYELSKEKVLMVAEPEISYNK